MGCELPKKHKHQTISLLYYSTDGRRGLTNRRLAQEHGLFSGFRKTHIRLGSIDAIPRAVGNNRSIGDDRRQPCAENEKRKRDRQHILLLIVDTGNNNNGTGGVNLNNNFKCHGPHTVKLFSRNRKPKTSFEKHSFRVLHSK